MTTWTELFDFSSLSYTRAFQMFIHERFATSQHCRPEERERRERPETLTPHAFLWASPLGTRAESGALRISAPAP